MISDRLNTLSGIYEIRNRFSNRSYIGQAVNFKNRWLRHRLKLLSNKSHNKFLQNDFNKCKERLNHDDFLEFHIIEIMKNSTKEERNQKEEYWIKEYKENGYKLYNFREKSSGWLIHPMLNKENKWGKHSEETKLKLSKVLKGKNTGSLNFMFGLHGKDNPFFGKKMSDEFKKNLSEKRKGSKNPMYGKFGLFNPRGKEYNIKLLSPNNEIIDGIKGLHEFCRKYNLNPSHMSALIKGKRKICQGWKIYT